VEQQRISNNRHGGSLDETVNSDEDRHSSRTGRTESLTSSEHHPEPIKQPPLSTKNGASAFRFATEVMSAKLGTLRPKNYENQVQEKTNQKLTKKILMDQLKKTKLIDSQEIAALQLKVEQKDIQLQEMEYITSALKTELMKKVESENKCKERLSEMEEEFKKMKIKYDSFYSVDA